MNFDLKLGHNANFLNQNFLKLISEFLLKKTLIFTRSFPLGSVSDRLMHHNQWRIVEQNKQCNPVSVLEEIDLLQAIPVYNG